MNQADVFGASFAGSPPPLSGEYRLLESFGGAFTAWSPEGLPSLVIPLPDLPQGATGRRSGGCELLAFHELVFTLPNRAWRGPAAVLACLETSLLDVFSVLAVDLVNGVGSNPSWKNILSAVENWFALLRPGRRLSAEAELGLWGEVWFLERSNAVDLLVQAWRGPETDNTDFFLGGASVEIKTSRSRLRHHVSQTQVMQPVGVAKSWLLSLWVKPDPTAPLQMSLGGLVTSVLRRANDRAAVLRCLALAGYSPSDHAAYDRPYALLEEPLWFPTESIPRVRVVDPGVSRLRYEVSLEGVRPADGDAANNLSRHFHLNAYP